MKQINQTSRLPFRRRLALIGRRGNTIVLVSAILVLLVIVASAYLTRTQSGRLTATAVQHGELRDAKARQLADTLAQEVTLPLFPLPIDPADPEVVAGRVADSSYPRLSLLPVLSLFPQDYVFRYWVDYQDNDGDGFLDYPYNFAPYQVVPFTNWPDNDAYPFGLNNLGGLDLSSPSMNLGPLEGNPVGNPGFGDARWLADFEPMRRAVGLFGVPTVPLPYITVAKDTFYQWRHPTNIARPNNGFRIVTDISDMFDLRDGGDGLGLLLTNLSIPVEQWLTIEPTIAGGSIYDDATGDALLPADIEQRFRNWFSLGLLHENVYDVSDAIPPNFLNLGDLFNLGTPLEDGERPLDEFVPGTARHEISRFLADADGDGYTDSFWFLVPTSVERGIRQIVAVRIVDNSAMLNVNVATRAIRNDQDFMAGSKTLGTTPSDVAMVGQNDPFSADLAEWNVGYGDNRFNNQFNMIFSGDPLYTPPNVPSNVTVGWDPSRWVDLRTELGIFDNPNFPEQMWLAEERRQYFQESGRQPDSPSFGLTPFGPAEEIELRMYHGNNYQNIYSRFERALNSQGLGNAFLRANNIRRESSEYLEQLGNRELRYDHRHRLTMYSGARNDLMPPWLWEDAFTPLQKIDLRAPMTPVVVRDVLTRALLYEDGTFRQSYYGPDALDARHSEQLAAAITTNLIDYRDDDDDPTVLDIPPGFVTAGEPVSFVGMERQPFLLETFIGHVYQAYRVPSDPILLPAFPEGFVWDNAGSVVVFEPTSPSPEVPTDWRTTIIAVQIANPFDQPIDLNDYVLEFFGQSLDLATAGGGNIILEPATDEFPSTAIFYAIDPALDGVAIQDKWLDFFDLEDQSHPLTTDIIDVNAASFGGVGGTQVWSTDRRDYDTGGGPVIGGGPGGTDPTGPAVVLKRKNVLSGGGSIVVDRIDAISGGNARAFGDAVNEMYEDETPVPYEEDADVADLLPDPDAGFTVFPGTEIATATEAGTFYWVRWVRGTRAWGVDVDGDRVYEPEERNPRYIFGDRAVVKPFPSSDGNYHAGGNRLNWDCAPDEDFPGGGAPSLCPAGPWFLRNYHRPEFSGMQLTDVVEARKPTFFDMNQGDPTANPIPNFPDKGWYAQPNDPDDEVASGGSPETALPFAMQMLQKDRDFDQVGELLNVWLFGHGLDGNGETLITFSEYLAGNSGLSLLVGQGARVNRLRTVPRGSTPGATDVIGGYTADELLNGPPPVLTDPRHRWPALPAGIRLLDAFVCDGPGTTERWYSNANRFSGQLTPGLINVNTASVEVMRALPHLYRLTHEESGGGLFNTAGNPFVGVAEATVQYRDRLGNPLNIDDPEPGYGDRGAYIGFGAPMISATPNEGYLPGLRDERGIASPNELLLLRRAGKSGKELVSGASPNFVEVRYDSALDASAWTDLANPTDPGNVWLNSAWRIDYPVVPERDQFLIERDTNLDDQNVEAVEDQSLFRAEDPVAANQSDPYNRRKGAELSTDVVGPIVGGSIQADRIALDAEEESLLFAGLSNLITTRSDMFTVYFQLRSFRQNPVTGVWDALDKEQIVDDSRYVMLVDRGEVNSPADKPRIIYIEKVPN